MGLWGPIIEKTKNNSKFFFHNLVYSNSMLILYFPSILLFCFLFQDITISHKWIKHVKRIYVFFTKVLFSQISIIIQFSNLSNPLSLFHVFISHLTVKTNSSKLTLVRIGDLKCFLNNRFQSRTLVGFHFREKKNCFSTSTWKWKTSLFFEIFKILKITVFYSKSIFLLFFSLVFIQTER